jgi:transcriptional/translational regulatory protein YebC/TACO1
MPLYRQAIGRARPARRRRHVRTLRVIDALEENDDVQKVFANFDISDEVVGEEGNQ